MHYHGWQRQPSLPTIQGVLEKSIRKISGEKTTVIGAGRTDAGVHAMGQVAHFKTRSRLNPDHWQKALNSVLPADIVILKANRVSEKFHSRYDANGKIYQYQILNRNYRCAVNRQYRWVIYPPLNLRRMRAAAHFFRGRHDFSAFQAGSIRQRKQSSICTIKQLLLTQNGNDILITFEADRFLHQMIRLIVGMMVAVGKGKRNPAEVKRILLSQDRPRAGRSAPPNGLFLITVKY